MTFKPVTIAMITAGVLAVSTAGAISFTQTAEPSATTPPPQPLQLAAAAPAQPIPMVPAQTLVPDYRAIVKQAGPAVVGVRVQGLHKVTAQEQGGLQLQIPPGAENDPFFQFFRGLPGFELRRQNPSQPFRGQGSGFIVSSDGLILTNAHVVREAKDVTVKLSDRREFSAKVLGADTVTDVAVLKIDAKDLPTVRIGNPALLEVGDPVLAIGAPFGLEQTATSGIVSAKGRSLPNDAVVPFIQTDAAVNPGNSGGPLFDANGNVVGINAQIYSHTGGYQGLSFAIPIDVGMKVREQIVATGRVQHARLGVTIQELSQPLAESFGLKRPDGALVASVTPKSAAESIGLKAGDVIVEINATAITSSGMVPSLIGLQKPGDRVKLKVWRNGGPVELAGKLGGAQADETVASSDDATSHDGQLGLSLRPLTRDERRHAQLDQGLVVEDANGAAARAGIVPGDVVLAINGRPVQSVAQVQNALSSLPKSVALLVQRGDLKIFVPVALG